MENSNKNDEKINGPRVAAKILNSLPPTQKKRLLNAIITQDPELFQAISLNIINFEDIVEITDISIQRLIKEVDHKDLVTSLKAASPEVSEALFRNMSSGKRRLVQDDLQSLPPLQISDVEEAQRRICLMIDRLRTLGVIVTGGNDDEYV